MRLHRHDEIVEAMARAIFALTTKGLSPVERERYGDWDVWAEEAAAALAAMLEAVVKLKVAKAAGGLNSYEDHWSAYSVLTDVRRTDCADFHALILKLEPKP
jgi:hypothetical protein